jgi:hypothetical protein
MKSVWKWILFGLAVFLLAFCVAFPLLGGFAGLPLRATHAGVGFLHRGMMAGWDGAGMLGLPVRLAIPVLAIVLLAAVFVWLLGRRSATPPPAATPCPSCGKSIQVGWVACPYCGNKL